MTFVLKCWRTVIGRSWLTCPWRGKERVWWLMMARYMQGGEAAPTRAAEVYDPVKDEWESIPPMFTARQFAGAASLG